MSTCSFYFILLIYLNIYLFPTGLMQFHNLKQTVIRAPPRQRCRPIRKRPVGPPDLRHSQGSSATSAVSTKHGGAHREATCGQTLPVHISIIINVKKYPV